ncbi:hypothetical protein M0804_001617 [Polistes exclamans]|nr:hypothetical protein M0804_001617 [Polistes exclamans]
MAVRVVLPGTPPGTATLPPRTVPLIPVPPHDTLPSPPSAPPPATGAPDDAVDAYANSNLVCSPFSVSFVSFSSFTTEAMKQKGTITLLVDLAEPRF